MRPKKSYSTKEKQKKNSDYLHYHKGETNEEKKTQIHGIRVSIDTWGSFCEK